jgi:hypothetical protein
VDFSARRDELGFEAAWSIPDGAAELYREYISARLTADDFFTKFTRLPYLESLRAGGVLDESMRRITADA